jgi:GNAT superfamily N-acetyltransferase
MKLVANKRQANTLPKFQKLMNFREARLADIPQIQIVRNSVKENMLSNPALVTDKDCENYLINRGKGWVCEIEDRVVGFAIVDLVDRNVWALFIQPVFEGKGIGRRLHDDMLDWYFSQTNSTIWLGTAPGTRAEIFYRKSGWKEVGVHGKGEIKFEMTADDWRAQK